MSDNNTKTFYADAGKGDRPRGTGWKNYYSNWDSIFGKKDEIVLGDGDNIPPMTQEEIDELNAVLDQYEESGCSTTVEVTKADEG